MINIKRFIEFAQSKGVVVDEEKAKVALRNAIKQMNELTNRELDYKEHMEIIDGRGGITIVLSQYPATEVKSIEVLTEEGWKDIFEEGDSMENATILIKEVGIIKMLKTYIIPKGEKNIRVTYSAGYTEDKTPSPLATAIMWIALGKDIRCLDIDHIIHVYRKPTEEDKIIKKHE